MKLFIPLLDNGDGSVKSNFVVSLLTGFAGQQVHFGKIGDSHPGRARNRAAAEFLATDCTHLLFIDADIIFTPQDIKTLAECDEPIVAGMYPKKVAHALEWCMVPLPGNEGKAVHAGDVFPVRRAGTGFIRIAREVFERLKCAEESSDIAITVEMKADRYGNHGRPEWDFFKSGVHQGEWLSEDWYFCDMARSNGFRVMMHSGIQLRHEGGFIYPTAPDRLEWCNPQMRWHIERIWRGEYDTPVIPRTVLDIGANIGGFAVWATERWPGCKVDSYEPHPDNCHLFRLNTKGNPDITLHEYGVSDTAGEFVLREGQNIGEHSFHPGMGETGATLTALVLPAGSLKSAEFVKLDTEGCELEILTALDLSATRAIALEYHRAGDLLSIRTFLNGKGYIEYEHEPITAERGILKFLRG